MKDTAVWACVSLIHIYLRGVARTLCRQKNLVPASSIIVLQNGTSIYVLVKCFDSRAMPRDDDHRSSSRVHWTIREGVTLAKRYASQRGILA